MWALGRRRLVHLREQLAKACDVGGNIAFARPHLPEGDDDTFGHSYSGTLPGRLGRATVALTPTSIIRVASAVLLALAASALARPALAQRGPDSDRMHTHGLFLGVGGMQMTIESETILPSDEGGGRYGFAGRVGYGFGDYVAVVLGGDLARVDMTHDAVESEFEFAHIAIGARVHPFRALGRFGPFVEGSWLRYAATTDRAIAPATVKSRMTLEGTGAAAAAGLTLFLTRALSLEGAAVWTDGKLTKASGAGADGDFEPVPLQSRLYRVGLTWWLGT
jgi:hypothetical protein